jgi:hypothetical protein
MDNYSGIGDGSEKFQMYEKYSVDRVEIYVVQHKLITFFYFSMRWEIYNVILWEHSAFHWKFHNRRIETM